MSTPPPWEAVEAAAVAGAARRRAIRLGLGGAALLGCAALAHGALTATVGGLAFGAPDLTTARWLWRTDPIRRRGRAAALGQLALAGLRVCLSSFGVMLLNVILMSCIDPHTKAERGEQDIDLPDAFMGTLFACILGLGAAWLLGTCALVAALRNHYPIWIGSETALARRRGVWPPWVVHLPILPRPETKNRMSYVVWAAVIPWLTLLVMSEGAIWHAFFLNSPAGFGGMSALMLGSIVGPLRWIKEPLERRVVAASPKAAWKIEAP